LGQIVNPSDVPILPGKHADDEPTTMRVGDKVVRTKNGMVKSLVEIEREDELDQLCKIVNFNDKSYVLSQCHVVNGDGGEVVGFQTGHIVVRFSNPDRLCLLPKSDAKITFAYALTVHKCQGSGFPVVIIPLADFYWNERDNTGLFSRELIYTAFSRPQDRLITVGPISEVYKAVGRVTINQRKTRLKEMLGETS
jgi:ATP-dependent exoDNAse (exonuclease V) alpha subunit